MVTASGTVETNGEATVYDHPEVLPLGMFCETMGLLSLVESGRATLVDQRRKPLKTVDPETMSQPWL